MSYMDPPLVEVNHQDASMLKQHLISEITHLERQCERLRIESDTVDFSMIQTYKEMIHSRKEMLAELPRQPV